MTSRDYGAEDETQTLCRGESRQTVNAYQQTRDTSLSDPINTAG